MNIVKKLQNQKEVASREKGDLEQLEFFKKKSIQVIKEKAEKEHPHRMQYHFDKCNTAHKLPTCFLYTKYQRERKLQVLYIMGFINSIQCFMKQISQMKN